MSWLDGAWQRVRMLFRRRTLERELEEELRFHAQQEMEMRMARGAAPGSARTASAVSFGGADRIREEVRDEWTPSLLIGLWQDVRRGVRRLAKRPVFTTTALLTLGLGIGANTVVFSLVRGVLLEPLPYPEAERLVHIWNRGAGLSEDMWLSKRELVEYRAATRSFEGLAAYTDFDATLSDGDDPERVRAGEVIANVFDVLGTPTLYGRAFAEEDAVPGNHVAVIGYDLWRRRYGADRSLIGGEIRVNGESRTVVGVMPPGFRLPLDYREIRPTELWIPAVIDRTQELPWGERSYFLVGRLLPGVSVAQAEADVHAATQRWCTAGIYDDECEAGGRVSRDVLTLEAVLFGGVRPALLVLFGAVIVVLLVACANVAHLQLAHADARRREIATQVALGAGRVRIVRQLLVESGLLAVLGSVVGIALAVAGLRSALALTPVQVIRTRTIELDLAVLVFTGVLALATTVLAGAMPAVQLAGVDPANALSGSRGDVSRTRRGVRRVLVIGETALSVLLVVGAGLLARSFTELRRIDLGYQTENRLTARLSLPERDYPEAADVARFYERIVAAVRALTGVEAAAAVRILPLSGTIGDWTITLEHRPTGPGENPNGDWQVVTPGYFETMGLSLVAGRFLEPSNGIDAPLVAIVNETMAERYWPGGDAVGQRFHLGTLDQPWIEIVGVARDVRHNAVVEAERAEMYLPHAQFGRAAGGGVSPRSMSLVVRTAGDPFALVGAIREQVKALDPRLPLSEIRTMDEIAAAALAQPRFTSALIGLFAAMSLALAAIGLYGVLSFTAAGRTREIGIRMALGAHRRTVVGLVLYEGMLLALVGGLVGLLGAAATGRLLHAQLYGVSPLDPLTFTLVPTVLLAGAAAASYLPARRAARVSPVTALRME